MNPGPGFGGGPGIDGAAIAQSIVTLLVLGGVVLFGVLVLRRLGAIERAVRGEPARVVAAPVAAPVVQAPASPVAQATDADQRAWQQQAPSVQADSTAPPQQQQSSQQQLRDGPAPA
ncbi:hypothetical protein [Agrococcus jejuensis]|uniref:hypothetical protein n=1 Tax=Agrococcus jejuensis TaxID=399736 RepID=UPI0011A0A4B4|nr:hypothetical protein [Agrococcus jejuensis]